MTLDSVPYHGIMQFKKKSSIIFFFNISRKIMWYFLFKCWHFNQFYNPRHNPNRCFAVSWHFKHHKCECSHQKAKRICFFPSFDFSQPTFCRVENNLGKCSVEVAFVENFITGVKDISDESPYTLLHHVELKSGREMKKISFSTFDIIYLKCKLFRSRNMNGPRVSWNEWRWTLIKFEATVY